MDRIIELMQGEVGKNVVLALLHSLWQGALIAGLLYMFLTNRKSTHARYRYTAAVAGGAAVFFCALLTWGVLNYKSEIHAKPSVWQNTTQNIQHEAQPPLKKTSAAEAAYSESSTSYYEETETTQWHNLLLSIWLVGVAIMIIRTIQQLLGAGRMRRLSAPLENHQINTIIARLCESMKIARNVRVAVSEQIDSPGVIGFIWPTILIPASMLSGIPAEDLKLIFAHELAHIKRYDFLVNFCQMIVESLLFFNPAVWWISRQIRIEREACCDSAGVALGSDGEHYARVLADWASRICGKKTAALAGFSEAKHNSTLLDRVKRIIVPAHHPKAKLPWFVTTWMMIWAGLVVVLLGSGINQTVAWAGELLTPEQRIEQITEINKTHSYKRLSYEKRPKIIVSGTVKTWDDKPIPPKTYLTVRSNVPSSGYSMTIGVSADGNFKASVPHGKIFVLANIKGYAPGQIEPTLAMEEDLTGLEIILQKGFKSQIEVTDKKGDSIKNANLLGGFYYENMSRLNATKLQTDESGIAIIGHAASHKMGFNVSAKGFEPAKFENLVLQPDKPTVLKLTKAAVTSGVVVSAETGKPISGAEVLVLMERMTSHHSSSASDLSHNPPVMATGKNGVFELTELRRDASYLVLIKAKTGLKYLTDLKAGQKGLQVSLPAKNPIRGKIIGPLGKLKNSQGKYVINYNNIYRFGHHGSSMMGKQVEVTVRDGVGYFAIDDYYGQKVRITAGDSNSHVVNTQVPTIDEVIIDLSPPGNQMRKVVITFDVPKDSPPARGSMRINYNIKADKPQDRIYRHKLVDIKDGRAEIEIPVPCKLKYSMGYNNSRSLIGYWFKESTYIEIKEGDKPFDIKIPAKPAGAIFGQILFDGKQPSSNTHGGLLVAKKPAGIESTHGFLNMLSNTIVAGKYNATPLPFGGTYVIVALNEQSIGASKPLKLDESNPIIKCDLNIPKGITLKGRMLDTNGNPLQLPVQLDMGWSKFSHGWSGSHRRIKPDENGWFAINNVNPDWPGEYYLAARDVPGYRPIKVEIKKLNKPTILKIEKGKTVRGILIDDKTGWPIPGAEVYAMYFKDKGHNKFEQEHLEADAATNEKGEFIFTTMGNRKYELHARELNPANQWQHVYATGGQGETVILRKKIPHWSELKALKPD